MIVKLHFSRNYLIDRRPWCLDEGMPNADSVVFRVNGKVVGETYFNPDMPSPRGWITLNGKVSWDNGVAYIDLEEIG